MNDHFPPDPGARQIVDMHIEQVQTSCGFGVPLFDYRGEQRLFENGLPEEDWLEAEREVQEALKREGIAIEKE